MEFAHHDSRPQPTQPVSQTNAPMPTSGRGLTGRFKGSDWTVGKWLRVASVALLFSGTILLVAIAGLLYYGNGSESRYVDTSKYQAVDIDVNGTTGGDQIYFGKVVRLNEKYLVLQNIYYITPSQSAQSNQATTNNTNYTLVKAGCELVGAYDQMVINRDHVIFWENLKSNGTVAQKIAQYQQQNPNGPTCNTSNSTSNTSSPTTTTPSTNSSTSTNSSSSSNSSTTKP